MGINSFWRTALFLFSLILPLSIIKASWFSSSVSRLLGHIEVPLQNLTVWANSPQLNNEHCVIETQADACEDIKIHFSSGTVFAACGDPAARTKWYPPSGRHDAAGRPDETWQEKLFAYDIDTRKMTELRLEGLEGDFITHGLDILDIENETGEQLVHIFAVNHARAGDRITIFSHVLGSDSAKVIKEVRHKGIRNANGVAATGPFSFYITNDHFFTSKAGILRTLEERMGPFSWATEVQHCDASGISTTCHQVFDSFPGANGLLKWQDELWVGDCRTAQIRGFRIGADKSLQLFKAVDLGGAADNINVIPTTGDLIVTLFPDVEQLPSYLADVRALSRTVKVPSAAIRLVRGLDFASELLYMDDGGVSSYATVTAVDFERGVLVVGSVLQYGGFAVCDLKS